MTTHNRNRLKTGAAPLVLGLALIASPAMAQVNNQGIEAADVVDAEDVTQTESNTIVVTGSRIQRPDVDSTSPVTIVGAQEIQQTGTTRVEDLVNSLPQVFAGQNSFISNGASGTATVNLRGLGSARTLVLVNGRRMQPGDPTLPVADLNQIPAALVKRVEISTGGASSVYGADAVAGVVNFIMDTDFEGVELSSQYSFYQHEQGTRQQVRDALDRRGFAIPRGTEIDGQGWDSTLVLGSRFGDDRGHFVGYLGYRQVKPVLQRDRDYSACALSFRPGTTDGFNCGGSATAPFATIADPTFGDFFFGSATGGNTFADYQGPYNFAPINYFQRPNKRYTAGFFGNFEINPSADVYGEFMFMDSRTVAQIAESGTFFNQYDIACDSPLLTAAQGAQLCGAIDGQIEGVDEVADGVVPILIGKRNVEGGPRRDDLRHTSYKGVLGIRGDITDNWRYDASAQFGTTIFSQTYFNDFSTSRLRNALDAVVDANGNVVCRSVVNGTDPNCRPYNPFQGVGVVTDPRRGVTAEALAYVNTPGFARGETKEWIVNGFVSGDIGSISGASPVGVVLGAEYRKVLNRLDNDVAFQTGDLAGQGGPQDNVYGKYSVRELFGELLIPIIEDRPFFDNLSLELGYRFSDYTTVGTTHTYKVAGEWAFAPQIKLRGGYNRAVRAPNVIELFSAQSVALFAGVDPCAGANPIFTQAQCANTGVTAAQYGRIAASPAGQYNQFTGGNPNLDVETADSYTAGIVIDGRGFAPGLTIKADYFNIKVRDAISGIGAQTILNQCGLTGDAAFCSLVRRSPISGSLFVGNDNFVINTTQNIGSFKTDGVDVGVNYGFPFLSGRAGVDFNGTWLNSLTVNTGLQSTVAGADNQYNCVGYHGTVCGTPNPEWRHTLRFSWDMDNGFGLAARWRHFGSVDIDSAANDPDIGSSTPRRADIGQQNYFDVSAKFDVADTFEFTVGVNNILDRDPPIVDTAYSSNGNTYAEVYDPIGRYVFIGGRMRF